MRGMSRSGNQAVSFAGFFRDFERLGYFWIEHISTVFVVVHIHFR